MLTKRAILASFVLSALASPLDSLVVQDSTSYPHNCAHTESTNEPAPLPEVLLDDGVFTGMRKGATDQFLGIPFAYPPTGELRLRLPEPLPPYSGLYYVQEFGRSCPQQRLVLPNGLGLELAKNVNNAVSVLYERLTPDDEDCLTINVVRPWNATSTSKLPVVFWIFGGGFEIGGSSTYDGGSVVSRSIDLGQPIIFVSVNYRLSALGFLPGKEVKAEKVGNLGLQDQRLALKWVQTYITQFGGDPSKVTIWGESAGAISVALHMLSNNGNHDGLFRGAIMQSGGPIPVGDIENGQRYYDFMVEKTGCSNSTDTLDCLRKVQYNTFKQAMDESPNFFAYQGLVLAWLPRVDGVFLTEPPLHSVMRGHVANVPLITGNCDDEGALFSLATGNISTAAGVKDYLQLVVMPKAKESEVDLLLKHYPDDQRAGCPFDTGLKNIFSAHFKRTAALQGDFVFHGPRRFLLNYRADKQKSWAFIYRRNKAVPYIGAAHASDLVNSFGDGGELRDYIIRFTNDLDPNGKEGLGISWPQWDAKKPEAIIFQDSVLVVGNDNYRTEPGPLVVGDDDYRTDPINYIMNLSLIYPI